MWTIESEWVLTWLIGLEGDQRKLSWTNEGEWVFTWLTGLDGDLRKLPGRSRVSGFQRG